MSGWVLAYGNADRKEVERMLAKTAYRGDHLQGILADHRVIMAQNYLVGDVNGAKETDAVPVKEAHLAICYDGQMGNWKDRARITGTPDGPFSEERLLLDLFRKQGRDLLHALDDAVFAFAISDGTEFFAARDLLGIKTLFYGTRNGTLYLASELKNLIDVCADVREFPPGHYMDASGRCRRFVDLPETPPPPVQAGLDEIIETVRDIISRSVCNRIRFDVPTGALLSGGIDSSVIASLASRCFREKFGASKRLKTFALGVGESEDVRSARIMADHIRSEHHERIVDLDQMLSVLSDVIYYLESFDPSLVRSAVANFLVSETARNHGIDILLSGEGGDEVFCGYTYLKEVPPEDLFYRQMDCLRFLHNNASLRLDRMNHCHSIRVVAPLISGELLAYALTVPPQYKQMPAGEDKIEKWIFRKAFEAMLPESIVWRLKKEFSQGSGSAGVLPGHFEGVVSDDALAEARAEYPFIRSKEELYYFNIFTDHFGAGPAVHTVGQWVSL